MPYIPWTRRKAISLILGGLSSPFARARAVAVTPPRQTGTPDVASVDSATFTASTVTDLAQDLASRPYRPPTKISLGSLATISQQDYAQIKYKAENVIWATDKIGFAIEPLHPGANVTGQMQIHLVEDGVATRLIYDPARFAFGKVAPPAANAKLEHSGFRILKLMRDGTWGAVASFQDASYYTAIAQNQIWGLIARPLTVRIDNVAGEEAPLIRTVWIEKPSVTSTALVLHALIDSPSLAAAYRFTLRADDAAILDTECTIFARAALGNFGLTAAQATYFFGTLDRRNIDDVRPAAYEVNGVQMLTGSGEWLWRPVTNRTALQISGFVDENPRGFGFLQRDRAFEDFLDDENQWQRRPSLWIEPIGEWGPGEVTLVEVPAVSQYNKNVALYWRPKSGLAKGSKSHFAYRQFWCWTPPARPAGAVVNLSRMGRAPGNSPGSHRRFLVQFNGGPIGEPDKFADIEPKVWVSAGKVLSVRGFRSSQNKNYRVIVDVDLGGRSLIELRLALESKGKQISEAWLYRWTQ